MLNFEDWYNENEEELSIKAAESGIDREYDFDSDDYIEREYEKYRSTI
jgi:hypothetical protein